MDQALNPRELMLLAKQGDSEAFALLYEQFFTPIFRYVRMRVSDEATAEDITQTTFLKVYGSIENFKDMGKSPLAYFFTVARNAVIDLYKKNRRQVTLESEDFEKIIPASDDNPKDARYQEDKANDLHRMMKTLPDDQREALLLRFSDDLSNTEIASIMGKKEDTVRQLQCRGLKALRNMKHLKSHL